MKPVRKWRLKSPFCCAIAAFFGCALASQPPKIPTGVVESVEITLEDMRERQKPAQIISKDRAKIEALLAVLRRAKATEDHKCGASGRIVLHFKDASTSRLEILAGHNKWSYEFRAYSGESYEIFRVDRHAFGKAMSDLGIPELDRG